MKRAVAIRHVHFEDLGSFGSVIAEAGFDIGYADIGDEFPADTRIAEADLLVVLGGPISVYDGLNYPFLSTELKVIEARLAANRPTLGVCLGAQLMAKAAGAGVYKGEREIGFGLLNLTPDGEKSCLSSLRGGGTVLHWHGDTFDLPRGATLLASTAATPNQAFAIGANLLALQFHLEVSDGFERWLVGHTHELATHGIDPRHLREQFREAAPEMRLRARQCLREWLGGLYEA